MKQTARLFKSLGVAVIVSTIALTVLTSCATLPEPADGSDTAFVLPVVRVARTGGTSTFGYYEIHIEHADDPSIRRMVKVYAGTDMRVITGLEPGRYVIRRYQFVYKNGGMGSSRDIDAPFVLEAGAITVSPTAPVITLYKKDPEASTNWMRIGFKETQPPTRQEVLNVLEEEDAFPAWRVLSHEESKG
jgi:hypothetical protein